MARLRQDYSLFPRTLDSGKTVWYYRTYTPDGIRTNPKSTGIEATGKSSRIRAEKHCNSLMVSGQLWQASNMRFSQFADGWFVPGKCAWLADRLAAGVPGRPAISAAYLKSHQTSLRLYILPYFGEKRLENIKPSTIKAFRVAMQERYLSNKTINIACDTFRIMTDWMLAEGLIFADPFRSVKRLGVEQSSRRAFTIMEARKIFHGKWSSHRAWLFNLTAAITGMRFSEIRAIRADTLHADYIDVVDQFIGKGLFALKTKEARKVPIPPALRALLAAEAWKGFIFADIAGGPPLARNGAIKSLALLATDPDLSFHSWRHFTNTWLLASNVSASKVRAVMGHSEGKGKMTEVYTDWSPEMFPEVYQAQAKLFLELMKAPPAESSDTPPTQRQE